MCAGVDDAGDNDDDGDDSRAALLAPTVLDSPIQQFFFSTVAQLRTRSPHSGFQQISRSNDKTYTCSQLSTEIRCFQWRLVMQEVKEDKTELAFTLLPDKRKWLQKSLLRAK